MAQAKPRRNQLSDSFEALFYQEQVGRGIADPVPYIREVHDFVQLKALEDKAKELDWPLTHEDGAPHERWKRALANYYRSEVGVRTLAHLCTNFSAYYKHPLDKFGQPLRIREPIGSGGWKREIIYRINEAWMKDGSKLPELELLYDQIVDEGLSEAEARKRLGEI